MKNRSQLIASSLLYFVTFLLLALFVTATLILVGFSLTNLILTLGFSSVLALVFGYLIAQHTQLAYQNMLTSLDNLLKESLHEIKIPIATIRANAQMIGKNSSEQKRAVRITDASRKLEGIYEELEYFISKEVRPSLKTIFDLKDLIVTKLDLFEERLSGWKVASDLEACSIDADLFGFRKIIDNLLDNAIKYSTDTKELSIVLKNGVFSIEDKGVGIKSDELARVYEQYYQSDPRVFGSGLGLHIVKKICDEHKIALKIESNNGTKISLDLATVLV